MRFPSLLTIAVFSTLPVYAFVAFDNFDCGAKNDHSNDRLCVGECISFQDYHSFRANLSLFDGFIGHCVRVFEDDACTEQREKYPNQRGDCVAVTTGTMIRSYKCTSMFFDNCTVLGVRLSMERTFLYNDRRFDRRGPEA
ncbi:hypothetical protein AURDEDRAFT_125250 [Auricularia subglabra TFB-10046 SS5]|nr:hypothetical protein AURDEDRAFT_125250 [Auricularia subglabra TFB-10046 SS5]